MAQHCGPAAASALRTRRPRSMTSVAMVQAAAEQWRQRLAERMMVSDGVATFLRSSWMAQADTVAAKRLGPPTRTVQHGKNFPDVAAPTVLPPVQPRAALTEHHQQVRVLCRGGDPRRRRIVLALAMFWFSVGSKS